jgi:hypothetical protein
LQALLETAEPDVPPGPDPTLFWEAVRARTWLGPGNQTGRKLLARCEPRGMQATKRTLCRVLFAIFFVCMASFTRILAYLLKLEKGNQTGQSGRWATWSKCTHVAGQPILCPRPEFFFDKEQTNLMSKKDSRYLDNYRTSATSILAAPGQMLATEMRNLKFEANWLNDLHL